MKIKLLILAVALLVGSQSFAQFKSTSFFGPVKDKSKVANTKSTLSFPVLDSSATKEDIVHFITAAGYSTGNQLMAGAGATWQHLVADGNGGWNNPYGAGIVLWALGATAPSVQNPAAFAVGPVITVLNGYVTVGGAYDFVNKKVIGVVNLSYTFLH